MLNDAQDVVGDGAKKITAVSNFDLQTLLPRPPHQVLSITASIEILIKLALLVGHVCELISRCEVPFNGITAVVHINAEPSFISLLQELKNLPGLGEGFLFFSQSGDISDTFSKLLDCCLERIKELYRYVRAHSTYCFIALDSLLGIIYLLYKLAWKEFHFEKVDLDHCIILLSPVMSFSYHRLHTSLITR